MLDEGGIGAIEIGNGQVSPEGGAKKSDNLIFVS